MTRKQQSYARHYGLNGPAVLSSIAKVMRAGRTGDPAKIEAERERHYAFMSTLVL